MLQWKTAHTKQTENHIYTHTQYTIIYNQYPECDNTKMENTTAIQKHQKYKNTRQSTNTPITTKLLNTNVKTKISNKQQIANIIILRIQNQTLKTTNIQSIKVKYTKTHNTSSRVHKNRKHVLKPRKLEQQQHDPKTPKKD